MTTAWPNLSDLLQPSTADAPIGWVGAPLAAGSVTPGRCDLAPAALRAVLRRIGRYDLDSGNQLGARIADRGEVEIAGLTIEEATAPIRSAVAGSVAEHALTLLIGGNNAVTRPGLLGMADALGLELGQCGLLTLDAHFDLRGLEAGLGNGNPVRALRDDGLPGANIAQIGLAPFANSREMNDFAVEGGHLVVSAAQVRARGMAAVLDEALGRLSHCAAILVDCDIDCLDRAQFPAAPGGRAGGLEARDLFAAMRRLAGEPAVRVIDLTEWDPPLDPTDLSALTAGRWLAETLAGFEQRAAPC